MLVRLLLLLSLRYPAIWRLDKSDRWKKMFESYDYMPRHTTTTQRADSSRKLGRGVSGELYSVRWLVRHKRRIAGFSCSEIRTLYAAAMTTVPCRALCVLPTCSLLYILAMFSPIHRIIARYAHRFRSVQSIMTSVKAQTSACALVDPPSTAVAVVLPTDIHHSSLRSP